MNICACCTYLDIYNCNSDGMHWCDKKLERHFATDPECSSFCKAYSRSDSAIKNVIDVANSHNQSSICYLTTMLCNILNLGDNNLYLKTIRKFRENVLQKDKKYKKLLVEYDIIGPKLANCLANDPLKRKIAEYYFNKYIIGVFTFIINDKNEDAINLYITMTNELKNFYNLNNYYISADLIDEADIEKSGHGQYIKKKITV